MTRGVLLRVAFYLLCSGYCRHYSSCVWHNTRQGATFAQGVLLNIESGDGGKEMESNRISSSRQSPRILTLLTTYNKRTVFAKANREAMEQRADGYESLMFITSDEEDPEEDGAVDYKYGSPHNHRLLGAITEAYARHKGEFDWMAIGDDDTVFLYNRATAFLSHIDHTQPIAIGSVDGLHPDHPHAAYYATCFSPSEKNVATSGTLADKGCCLDFRHPCKVPAFPSTSTMAKTGLRPVWTETEAGRSQHHKEHQWTKTYGRGGLFWSYGGSGTFLSAGMLESVQQGSTGAGWQHCTDTFGFGDNTDIQLGMCLQAHGFSTSTYADGFDRTCETDDPDEIEDRLAANCQVLGIHLGIRHLVNGSYTLEAFMDAAVAVHREDQSWASPTDLYMAQSCLKALKAIYMWE